MILVSSPFGGKLLHEIGVLLQDVVGILVRHQAHGDLGEGAGGNHGLGSGSGEAAGHAVDFKRRTRPRAVENGVAGFAGQDFRSDFGLAILLFIEGQPLPGLEFVFARLLHALIEAGDKHLAIGVLELADDFDEGKERIGRCAAVHAGMEVSLGSNRFNFRIDQPAQADAQSRKIGREQLGIAHQREVGFQFGFLRADVRRNRFTANFFFTFDNELHVERQLAAVGRE